MSSRIRVAVTMRALVQRINRRLYDDDQMLKKTRGQRASVELGPYYILDYRNFTVVAQHVDPEALGRELGALQPYEVVEEED